MTDQAKVEAAIILEFANMAVDMDKEQEYAGLHKVLAALQSHVTKLSNILLPDVTPVAEKKVSKK